MKIGNSFDVSNWMGFCCLQITSGLSGRECYLHIAYEICGSFGWSATKFFLRIQVEGVFKALMINIIFFCLEDQKSGNPNV